MDHLDSTPFVPYISLRDDWFVSYKNLTDDDCKVHEVLQEKNIVGYIVDIAWVLENSGLLALYVISVNPSAEDAGWVVDKQEAQPVAFA